MRRPSTHVPNEVFMRVPALPTPQELRRLASLAIPVTLVQLGLMAMGVEDTIIVGRFSPDALAAVAIGTLYFFVVSSLGMGMLMGLDPIVSQAVGAKEPDAVARAFQRGLLLVAIIGTLSVLSFIPAQAVLRAAGQPEGMLTIVGPYLWVLSPSTYAFLFFVLMRVVLQAHGRLRPILVSIAVANVINVGLSVVLVYGLAGFPRMGPVGSGVATSLARMLMSIGVLVAARRELLPLFRWRSDTIAAAPLWRVVQIGAPVGIQIVLEFGVFAVIGLLMGHLGTVPMAAHQIALNISSLTFMVPLGVGSAGSVLVGRAIGAGDPAAARRAALSAIVVGVGFMTLSAVAFLLAPRLIASAYTNDPATIALAAALIPIAGVFQVFDGTQVVSIGLLRGTGDTRTPMVMNLIGYWLVALPLSLWFQRGLGLGPRGLWWGIVVGLALVALVVLARARTRLGGRLERLHVEGAPPVVG
jgi:MATE family multidrug resistance protein